MLMACRIGGLCSRFCGVSLGTTNYRSFNDDVFSDSRVMNAFFCRYELTMCVRRVLFMHEFLHSHACLILIEVNLNIVAVLYFILKSQSFYLQCATCGDEMKIIKLFKFLRALANGNNASK